MVTDHSAFIEKYHRPSSPPPDKEPKKTSVLSLVLAVLMILGYFAFCLFLGLYMHMQIKELVAGGVVFIVAAVVGYFIKKIFHIRSDQQKQFELLREVLEGSRGARLITDAADYPVFYNQKFRMLCGDEKPENQPGLIFLSRLFEGDQEALAHFRLLAEQAQRGLTDSVDLCSKDGDRELWYTVTAQPVAGWAGYVHWRVDDITDRRANDRSIREEREKLIDFTDNAPVGFFSVDEKGRFVFINATLARWLGEDIQRLLTKGSLHTYFADPPENAHPYDIRPDGGAKQMAEVQMKGPGGTLFMASISQVVVHESGGTVRTRGIIHDLTTERAMRQALQASEDRFQRFFEEAPLGIALLGKERRFDDCNPALAAMLGKEIKDLEGQVFDKLVDAEDRDMVLRTLKKIEEGEEMAAPLEVTLLGAKKAAVVSLYARRLAGSENVVLHFIDLTDQKSLEQQFVQSQKMQAIGQLAGGVAHDFNNLLTAMIGFCDLLLLRHKPGDPSFSDIMQIKQNANRAANLVRQLLAFSRQQTLRPKVQDLTDILTEVSHLLRRLIGANIELEVLHGSDLGLVKVDVGQMEQVLINLAVNARDAMDDGGKLTVRTANFENERPVERGGDEMPPGQWVTMEVSDTGCGIAEENLARIFEPFFTTKEVGQGTGLGLATVYGIIRQTGGYLHVESKTGEGTNFIIYLPRLSDSEAEQEVHDDVDEEDAAHDLTGAARILLVEDEDAVRTFSSRALTNKGYEMLEADSGEAALDVLSGLGEQGIDLLITDVIMPNMDGPTLAQRVRQQSPNLKIIYISGYTEEKLKEHMGENIWFLPKPFTLKQLAAKVKEALEE